MGRKRYIEGLSDSGMTSDISGQRLMNGAHETANSVIDSTLSYSLGLCVRYFITVTLFI